MSPDWMGASYLNVTPVDVWCLGYPCYVPQCGASMHEPSASPEPAPAAVAGPRATGTPGMTPVVGRDATTKDRDAPPSPRPFTALRPLQKPRGDDAAANAARGHGLVSRAVQAYESFVRALIKPLRSPADTRVDVLRKSIFVPTTLMGTVTVLIAETLKYTTANESTGELHLYPAIAHLVIFVVVYARMYWTKRCTTANIMSLMIVVGFMIFTHDLMGASESGMRTWPLFVVLLDVLLLCRVPAGVVFGWVAAVCAWLVVTSAEDGMRFGLYDLPGLATMEERRRVTDCMSPPCGSPEWVHDLCISLFVFLFDFITTRGFAKQVAVRTAALEDSVAVARIIAEDLAKYNLSAAHATLACNKALLPEEMVVVFEQLLTNLRTYRPFLPDALFLSNFDDGDGSDSNSSVFGTYTPLCEATSTSAVSMLFSDPPPANKPTPPLLPSRSQDTRAVAYPPTVMVVQQTQLEERRVSLLMVQLNATAAATGDGKPSGAMSRNRTSLVEAPGFLEKHAATLELVVDTVRTHRGVLDFFNGETIQTSFNAFRSAANHAVGAVSAAHTLLTRAQEGQDTADPTNTPPVFSMTCAAATDTAWVGYLGTDTVRRPSIVGALPLFAAQVLQAACVVGERVVCTELVQREARFTYDLWALLHTFRIGVGTGDTRRRETLYALRKESAGCTAAPKREEMEWMYEVKDSEGSRSAVFNKAVHTLFHEGLEVARKMLTQSECAPDVADAFAKALLASKYVDLRPRCGPSRGWDGQIPSAATDLLETRPHTATLLSEPSNPPELFGIVRSA